VTLLAAVVEAADAVAATRSRLRKRAALAALLRRLDPDERRLGVAYLSGELPQGRIGLGYAAVRGLRGALGPPPETPRLTLAAVDAAFQAIADASGSGSAGRKRDGFGGLLGEATQDERSFLVRLLLGELRQGANAGVMADAVAEAAGLELEVVRRAAMLAGDLPEIADVALAEGAPGLACYRLELFRPVLPMLASPSDDVDAALGRLGEAALEIKLDGARVQVHKDGDEVRVYSRRLHDVTARVPEIVEDVRALPVRAAILDGEAIVLGEDGRPQPFQTTMRRFGRRKDVAGMRRKLPLSHLYFDVIRVDDDELLDAPLRRRLAVLDATLPQAHRIERTFTDDVAAAAAFFEGALDRGHEG
jgi:DNA ligase-1